MVGTNAQRATAGGERRYIDIHMPRTRFLHFFMAEIVVAVILDEGDALAQFGKTMGEVCQHFLARREMRRWLAEGPRDIAGREHRVWLMQAHVVVGLGPHAAGTHMAVDKQHFVARLEIAAGCIERVQTGTARADNHQRTALHVRHSCRFGLGRHRGCSLAAKRCAARSSHPGPMNTSAPPRGPALKHIRLRPHTRRVNCVPRAPMKQSPTLSAQQHGRRRPWPGCRGACDESR